MYCKMKMCKLGLMLIVTAITMLTSCLGESNNSVTAEAYPGVFRFRNTTMMVETIYGYIYSPDMMTRYPEYTDGSCAAVSFSFDMGAPENADADKKGYITASSFSVEAAFESGDVLNYTDTTQVMENEFAMLSGGYGMNNYQLCTVMSGTLFLTSVYAKNTNQESHFQMSLDPGQEPTLSQDGKNYVYKAFLRGTVVYPGKAPATNLGTTQGYDLHRQLEQINARELARGKSDYLLQIYYVSEINDSVPAWTPVELAIGFLTEEKK